MSSRSPTGKPTRLRHWVAYHSPDVMGYEFFECQGFAVSTNKWLRDMEGDIVWVIGRLGGTQRYFLDCRFRISRYENAADDSEFDYVVSGTDGIVFFPTPEITRLPWFTRLMQITSRLSVGLQAVNDPEVLSGLDATRRGSASA
jgi:hypothetical protein